MTQKQLIWIFVTLAVLIAVLLVWYFFFRDECDPNRNGYTKKGKLSDKCKVDDPTKTNTPPPSGTQWIPDSSFPLKKGMWGSKVKAVQKALGISDDGKFGPQTEAAIYARFKENTVSEPNYNSLINPAATGGGSNYSQLKEALKNRSANFSGGIKTIEQGKNQNYQFEFYTNGRVIIFDAQQKEVVRGTYSDGGKKISLDGGKSSQTNAVYLTLADIVKQIEA